MIKAFLFDLDDTLLDRTVSLIAFVQSHYQRFKFDHIDNASYQRRFLELDQRGYGPKPQLFHTLIAEFALPTTVEELLADFEAEAWHACTLLPHAQEVICTLRARGYRLGVITNGEDWSQMRKLRVTGLDTLFDVLVISANEQIKKPDPCIFTRTAERLALQPTECVFVGDHARNDIAGASAVGMTTVWFPGTQPWPADVAAAPDYTIASLADLLTIAL